MENIHKTISEFQYITTHKELVSVKAQFSTQMSCQSTKRCPGGIGEMWYPGGRVNVAAQLRTTWCHI